METNPTTTGPLADFHAEMAADPCYTVHLAPACIASFGGGSMAAADVLACCDLTEDDDMLIATDQNGKEWIVEM